MGKLFGTDGVRGVAGKELTTDLAYKLGMAGTYALKKEQSTPVIIIGKDTRVSGDMLEAALAKGIIEAGGNVITVGVIPTPAVAYLTKYYNAASGIVISASHNPYEYNGIKFFNSEGYKLADEIEDSIEELIFSGVDLRSKTIGTFEDRSDEADGIYVDFLVGTADYRLDGKKIVLDCANGASYKVAEMTYKKLGADLVMLANEPSGENINLNCGSTHPENLAATVLKEKAFMGLAFDGDADRLIAVDDKGRVVDGDKTIAIMAEMLKKEDRLNYNRATVTVMSNLGFHKAMEKLGVKVDVTTVGDRYVLESMLKTGSVIGGEQSGHIIFKNFATTGDGILSSIQLIRASLKAGKPLSEMADAIEIFPQVLVNAKIANKDKLTYREDPDVAKAITDCEVKMAGNGRVLIRPSGTEPLVRVMLEGKDIDEITKYAKDLAALIEKKFPLE